jgi:hypothetical protein
MSRASIARRPMLSTLIETASCDLHSHRKAFVSSACSIGGEVSKLTI